MARNPLRAEGPSSVEAEAVVKIRGPEEAMALLGRGDVWLRALKERLGARIVARGSEIKLQGSLEEVTLAEQVVKDLLALVRQGAELDEPTIERAVELALEGKSLVQETEARPGGLVLPRRLRPKTPGQRRYVEAIAGNDITFGIGPAGTGKTYLAV
ncbi:MAG TPA: PhoH family protein, partial [Oceanithermus sp.]|nr:PhoH family protein [Oceanithermus sp.]